MQTRLKTLLLSSVLVASPLCPAQEVGQSPTREPSPSAEVKASPAGVQKWIQQLGSDSYRDRLEAENALRALGEQAAPALRAAAEQTDDGEVQWRAKRLLRQLDRAPVRGLVDRARGDGQEPRATDEPTDEPRGGAGAPRDLDEVQRGFDRLFERFERDFGLDIPRRRFFDDAFFNDLKSQLRTGGRSHGTSIRIGPDGVKVEVQEQGEDGKLETKVYEAPDMKTFQEQYPDVLKQHGLGLGGDGLRFGFGRVPTIDRDVFGPGLLIPDRDVFGPGLLRGDEATPVSPTPPEGRRLGVLVKDIPPSVRDYLDLGDLGLMVQEVQPGTLAEALGLAADDIVVRIGAVDIASPRDVQEALGGIDVGQKVVVEYVRKGRRQTAEADKQKAAAPAREVLKPKSGAGGAKVR